MKHLLPALALLVAIAPPVSAQGPIDCDTTYRVQRGDSLSAIAGRAYGRLSAYQLIFDYNTGVMSDPNRLAVGVTLYIPCLDRAAGARGTPPEEALPPLPPAPADAERLRILTGSEYPPYVDEGLPNGGFSVELVERALLANGGASDFRVDVINDWTSHLQPLLSDGAYDLGFPWFRPDCDERERLGESSVWRCDNLRFSESLHDVVVTFHARSETAASVSTASDLEGMTLCRPRGYFTHDLEAAGLAPPAIERVAPRGPDECFELLLAGEVDVVSVNADTADRVLTALDEEGSIAELSELATVQTLHVVAMRGDPRGRVNLLRLNNGLRQLKGDGSYRKIADVHLR